MIVGIGIDLVETERIRAVLERHGLRFRDHVYTPHELQLARERCEATAFYAGRWAAKEAVSKALGCGIGAECALTDIEITNNGSGAPEIRCTGRAAMRVAKLGGGSWSISISHEKNHAVAVAVLERV